MESLQPVLKALLEKGHNVTVTHPPGSWEWLLKAGELDVDSAVQSRRAAVERYYEAIYVANSDDLGRI
jgi:hypothetical protein